MSASQIDTQPMPSWKNFSFGQNLEAQLKLFAMDSILFSGIPQFWGLADGDDDVP